MNRRNSITVIARALLVSVVVLVAGSGKSDAQQSAADMVKAAHNAFHAALGSLDVAKMAALWAKDAGVTLVNPSDKSVAVGWDAVKTDWENTFNANSQLKVTQKNGPYIQVKGDVAWVTGLANAELKLKTGDAVINALTFETDVYEKRGGQWLLVSHAAWRAPH